MSDTRSTSSGGIGLGGALLVLFIGLKLAGVITWSWFWVLSPAWIGVGIVAVLLFVAALLFAAAELFGRKHTISVDT